MFGSYFLLCFFVSFLVALLAVSFLISSCCIYCLLSRRPVHRTCSCPSTQPCILPRNLPAPRCGRTLDLETEIGKCLKQFQQTWKQDCHSRTVMLLIDLAMIPKPAMCLLPEGWPLTSTPPYTLCASTKLNPAYQL